MSQRKGRAYYMISVVAQEFGVHPQTLRMYEREGLVSPKRSKRNLRLYSDDDIERLRMIKRLTQDLGVNLAGVDVILDLLERVEEQQSEIDALRRQLSGERKALNPAPPASRSYRVELEYLTEEELPDGGGSGRGDGRSGS